MIWRFRLWLLEDPISGGRHKVIGSEDLYTSSDKYHCKSPPKAVGTAFAIDRAKDLNLSESKLDNSSIVICSFGDASANHATALSAFNTACWISAKAGMCQLFSYARIMGQVYQFPLKKNGLKKLFK